MRALIIRCSRFEFQDTARSTLGSDGEELREPLRGERYAEAPLVLVCIEKSDGEREVRNARDRVFDPFPILMPGVMRESGVDSPAGPEGG